MHRAFGWIADVLSQVGCLRIGRGASVLKSDTQIVGTVNKSLRRRSQFEVFSDFCEDKFSKCQLFSSQFQNTNPLKHGYLSADEYLYCTGFRVDDSIKKAL